MESMDIRKNLLHRLLKVHRERFISKLDLANEIGIQYNTLKLFLEHPELTRFTTLNKINEYVTRQERDLDLKETK